LNFEELSLKLKSTNVSNIDNVQVECPHVVNFQTLNGKGIRTNEEDTETSNF